MKKKQGLKLRIKVNPWVGLRDMATSGSPPQIAAQAQVHRGPLRWWCVYFIHWDLVIHWPYSLVFFFFFLSLHWICYNVASVVYILFGFFFFGWRHVGSDLPYQQSNPHLPHWKAKSLTLDNQQSSPSALNALPLWPLIYIVWHLFFQDEKNDYI